MSNTKNCMIYMAVCLIVAASFSACKSKGGADDADHPLIAAYTSGTISIQSWC